MGVLVIRALPFGVYTSAPDFWKLPYRATEVDSFPKHVEYLRGRGSYSYLTAETAAHSRPSQAHGQSKYRTFTFGQRRSVAVPRLHGILRYPLLYHPHPKEGPNMP